MDPYRRVDIEVKIRARQEALNKELDSDSDRADLLLITNNIEASVKDIYEFLKEDPNARQHRRKEILKELRKKGYINDNLKKDLEIFFAIRDEYAHNMIIDDAHKKVETLIEKTTFVKFRSSKDKYWKNRKVREKIIRLYNMLIPTLLNEWNNAVINEAIKNNEPRTKSD